MKMETKTFDTLVEDCLGEIRTQAISEAGFLISPAVCSFLSERANDEIVPSIVAATKPTLKRLLMSSESLGRNATSLVGAINTNKQGVFANILTNDADESTVKVFVGAAAGPYQSRSGGMRARIQNFQAEIKNKKASTVLHLQIAHTVGWHANWAILAAFHASVPRELVLITQAVMVILLGSCPRSKYLACRPHYLTTFPHEWGLNEMSPLRLDGLASYYKSLNMMDLEEAKILHQKRSTIGETCSLTARRRRQDRLKNGGPVRVYMFQQGGRVLRFFLTLMTIGDGAHVDVSIPLLVGLEYGLQTSRSVNINLDLSARNHYVPFATKAAYNSGPRRLGIMISGNRAVGPEKGAEFTHWLQSPRKAAIGQADKLVRFLLRESFCHSEKAAGNNATVNSVIWSGKSFLSTSQHEKNITHDVPALPESKPTKVKKGLGKVKDGRLYELLLRITKQLQWLTTSRKIRATPSAHSYFKCTTAESITSAIVSAIRPRVTDIVLSEADFTKEKLVAIGGNIRDESQGVYADIIANDDPKYFRIYVGAATSAGSHRYAGLRRRIQDHLRFAKAHSGHVQSGVLHSNELLKPGTNPNFVVLARFSEVVPIPLVHIAEALMAILFASWDNKTFLDLRPEHMSGHRGWGLNKANPLDFAIVTTCDSDERKARVAESARRRVAQGLKKSIEDARAGYFIRPHLDRARNSFRFKLCAETIMISAALGNSIGLKHHTSVKVECDLHTSQHASPYARKGPWKSDARRLGICLRGTHGEGPCRGQQFKKWIECNSNEAVARAERIIMKLES